MTGASPVHAVGGSRDRRGWEDEGGVVVLLTTHHCGFHRKRTSNRGVNVSFPADAGCFVEPAALPRSWGSCNHEPCTTVGHFAGD